ncbi:hypothetical protein [Actinokineospora enzanensis]|uniref:hypothetical protein n=1 Tax=Actinokineospora enzanensis TaxID=155975 RepID=UPI00037CDB92|nr:hypothetical protein [Actinokineospora enzanensis]
MRRPPLDALTAAVVAGAATLILVLGIAPTWLAIVCGVLVLAITLGAHAVLSALFDRRANVPEPQAAPEPVLEPAEEVDQALHRIRAAATRIGEAAVSAPELRPLADLAAEVRAAAQQVEYALHDTGDTVARHRFLLIRNSVRTGAEEMEIIAGKVPGLPADGIVDATDTLAVIEESLRDITTALRS